MKTCLLHGCKKKARIKFCSNKHKDEYHNWNNPRGKFTHLKELPEPSELTVEKHWANGSNNEHLFSGEGLGQD